MNGYFDVENRLDYLTANGDILPTLKNLIPWEDLRSELEVIYAHERKSNAGRRPFDVVMMFKILILQSLYNLSDDELEYQIMDRLSFMRFLGPVRQDQRRHLSWTLTVACLMRKRSGCSVQNWRRSI